MDMKASPLASLADASLLKTDALIDGRWVAGAKRFAVHDPATGLKLVDVANLGGAGTADAIAAADKGWPAWRVKTAKERAAVLMKGFALIHRHADDLARIMTVEQGKPVAESRGEIAYAASFVEWFSEEAKRVYGDVIPEPGHDRRLVVVKEPIGVVAAITPWNFPSAMITRKAAAALAAGCTTIIHPSPASGGIAHQPPLGMVFAP